MRVCLALALLLLLGGCDSWDDDAVDRVERWQREQNEGD
jgi:hypothetical protein